MAQHKIVTQFIDLPQSKVRVYEARPEDLTEVQAGLIVIQEIFGVDASVREIAESYAHLGFWVYAPDYFSQVEKDVDLPYSKDGIEHGMKLMNQIGYPKLTEDTIASGRALQTVLAKLPGRTRKIGVVGFCLGGSLSWTVSCSTEGLFQAASSYYGSQVVKAKDEQPNSPVIFHFGKKDLGIPLFAVERFQHRHPKLPVYLYNAGHGFANHHKKDFNSHEAKVAMTRTLAFFAKHLSVSL